MQTALLPALFAPLIGGLVGLLVGSFLNVVIHRLPKMLEREWANDCAELNGTEVQETGRYNLLVPRSSCPACSHQIRWYENIPLISYSWLKGRCSACSVRISLRYPLVELLTSGLFAFCAWHWGWSAQCLVWSGLAAALIALWFIDWDTTLLPDDITLPLVWAGLIAAAQGWTLTTLNSSLWGAVGAYLFLWSIYWGFKLLTGKEGMGHGDFKLFAALGAWYGWQSLIPIILVSSVLGAIMGLTMKFYGGLREGGYIPFGPFLAGAGLLALVAGPDKLIRTFGL